MPFHSSMERKPTLSISEEKVSFVSGWLLLAVLSLVFAGIFAFLVAMARTPGIKDLLPGKEYFYTALVTHVNLAVVIWFLAFMGMMWTLTASHYNRKLGGTGLLLSFTGTIFVIVSGLLGLGRPVLSNYIPVLAHPLFYSGLMLFASGILLNIMTFAVSLVRKEGPLPIPTFGMVLAGIMVVIAYLCFGLAYIFISGKPINPDFFERLFWGGGHVLQFVNTMGMVVAWVLLVTIVLKRRLPFSDRLAKVFLAVLFFFTIPAPFLYFLYDITGKAYKDGFTLLMQIGIGPTAGLFIIAISYLLWLERNEKGLLLAEPGISSLLLSLALFIIGATIALQIQGSNVKIPSHYHGVIGAVTISFMGLTYYILPHLGKEVFSLKASKIQPYLYGVGQILFVIGMFWAGREGVPRKTFGAAEVLTSYSQYIGMAIMGIGGLIAILGGATYVINILISFLGRDRKEVTIVAETKNLS